jgi:hypothetical protein
VPFAPAIQGCLRQIDANIGGEATASSECVINEGKGAPGAKAIGRRIYCSAEHFACPAGGAKASREQATGERGDGWYRVKRDPANVLRMGANGRLERRAADARIKLRDYLVDIDAVHELVQAGPDRR